MKRILTLGFVCLLLSALTPAAVRLAAELQVRSDKENVVASRLVGQWEPDAELTKRLGGNAEGTIAFKSDSTVATKIPAKYEKFLKDKPIFLAGTLTLRGKDQPFVLIEMKGNPYVVWFRERDGDPLGDAESFNVMLPVAKETANDLLFIGGDFNNQPFAAYKRTARNN